MNEVLQAEQQLAHLSDVERHPGFQLLCERYDEIVEENTMRILDTSIGDQETHDLKQQLSMLVRARPQQLLSKMKEKARKGVSSYSTRK